MGLQQQHPHHHHCEPQRHGRISAASSKEGRASSKVACLGTPAFLVRIFNQSIFLVIGPLVRHTHTHAYL